MIEKLQSYLDEVGESIRYIITIHFQKDADIPLIIKYVDNGGNMHHIGFNNLGMLTFE